MFLLLSSIFVLNFSLKRISNELVKKGQRLIGLCHICANSTSSLADKQIYAAGISVECKHAAYSLAFLTEKSSTKA